MKLNVQTHQLIIDSDCAESARDAGCAEVAAVLRSQLCSKAICAETSAVYCVVKLSVKRCQLSIASGCAETPNEQRRRLSRDADFAEKPAV